MIAIQNREHCVLATVAGEFGLADIKALEAHVLHEFEFNGSVALLIDLTDMLTYTVDVVWEELRFGHQHGERFTRVAVVCTDTFVSWAVWLSSFFLNADVSMFDDASAAETWLLSAPDDV